MSKTDPIDFFVILICEKKIISFILGCVFFIVSLAGAKFLHLDNDYRSFIGENNSALQVSDWLSERQNTPGESLILIYEPNDKNFFSSTSIIQYAELVEQASALPSVKSVDSLFDQEKLVVVLDKNGDKKIRSSGIFEGENLFDETNLATLKNEMLSLPTIRSRYLGADARNAAIILFLDFDGQDQTKVEIVSQLKAEVQKIQYELQELSKGDQLFLAGTVMFETEAVNVLRSDLRRIFPIAFLFICLIIYIVYRSLLFVPLALVVIFFPVLGTAGMAGWLGLTFSNLSVSALLLVGTLAVADVMHVSNTFFIARRENESLEFSLKKSLKSNVIIIAATTVTTSFGQFALLSSAAEPIRVMGLVIIIGAVSALVYATLMLPLVLSLAKKITKGAFEFTIAQYLVRVTRFSFRHSKKVLIVFSALLLIAFVGIFRTGVSDSLQGWFGKETDFYETMNVLDSNYLGADTLSIAIEATASDLISVRNYEQDDPNITDYKNLYHALDSGLEEGYWFSPIKAAENSAKSSFSDSGYNQEGIRKFSTETAARSGLLTRYEPGKKDYSLWYYDSESTSSFEAVKEAEEIQRILLAQSSGRDFKVGGIGLALSQLSVQNFWAIVKGSIITFALISIVMFFVFRSTYLGTISLLPNLAPIVVALGFWGIGVGHINLAAITVFSVALGIVVDDTIHILMKYQRNLSSNKANYEQAFEDAVGQSGVGIFVTTLILAIGFFLLSTSSFLLTAQKAFLVGVAIVFAFIFDVVALPALIKNTRFVFHKTR